MEFGLSEEQILLSDSVERMLLDTSPMDEVRDVVEDNGPLSAGAWKSATEMGLTSVLIPEQYGGMELGMLDAVLVQERLGRHVACVPVLGAALASIALINAGDDNIKSTWLPKIAEGAVVFGIAIAEQVGAREGAGVAHQDNRLSGKSLFVLESAAADQFIVATRTGKLFVVAADADGLSNRQLPMIDKTRTFGELIFDKVEATPLSCEDDDAEAIVQVILAGRILLAADTLGASQRMIEKAVAYSLERKQFKRIIGSYQAVKHMCAEMAAELEPCRSLVWYAAHAFDEVPDEAGLMGLHAKSLLADVGRFVARTSTEVHGGVGFTDLLGLHYWFKRIGFNRQIFGSPERAREEAAKLQGWAA